MRRASGILTAGSIALAGVTSLVSAPSCTVAGVCEGSVADYCSPQASVPCGGHLVDAYTWESSRPGQPWLAFEGERRWHLTLRDATSQALIAGRPFEVQVYVSATGRPEDPGGSFALAAGNLALVHVWCTQKDVNCTQLIASEPVVDVQNDTCAKYFVKVIVRAYADPIGPPIDAGSSDASAAD